MSEDWLMRSELLIGNENILRLKNSHVFVAGLGGVGAYTAEMLCRAGIGKLTLADGDVIKPSNRNRQLLALISNEGKLKTELMSERCKKINPGVEIKLINEAIRDERLIEILNEKFEYIVDAIDMLSPKIYLLYHAAKMKHKIVSSMGAGGKFDPLQIRIADISETYQCHFAHDIRKRLKRLGISTGVKAVFSAEEVLKEAVIYTNDERNKKSIVGTISYMPAIFGCYCASVVIRDLIVK